MAEAVAVAGWMRRPREALSVYLYTPVVGFSCMLLSLNIWLPVCRASRTLPLTFCSATPPSSRDCHFSLRTRPSGVGRVLSRTNKVLAAIGTANRLVCTTVVADWLFSVTGFWLIHCMYSVDAVVLVQRAIDSCTAVQHSTAVYHISPAEVSPP